MTLVSASPTIHGAGIIFPQPTFFWATLGSQTASPPLLLLEALMLRWLREHQNTENPAFCSLYNPGPEAHCSSSITYHR